MLNHFTGNPNLWCKTLKELTLTTGAKGPDAKAQLLSIYHWLLGVNHHNYVHSNAAGDQGGVQQLGTYEDHVWDKSYLDR